MRNPIRNGLFLGLALCGFGNAARAQATFSSLEECMSYKDFVALGLDKLTPEQRHGLDAWIRTHGASCVAPVQRAQVDSLGKPAASEIRRTESRIAGEFDGWHQGTVLVLENGQRWEVRDEEAVNAHMHSPKVVVEPGLLNGWTLTVEGVGEIAHVIPADRR